MESEGLAEKVHAMRALAVHIPPARHQGQHAYTLAGAWAITWPRAPIGHGGLLSAQMVVFHHVLSGQVNAEQKLATSRK